jgi:hypothetical protein
MHAKNSNEMRRNTTTRHHHENMQHIHISPLFLLSLNMKQRQALKKPLEVSQNHFQMENWQIKSLLRIQHIFTTSCGLVEYE